MTDPARCASRPAARTRSANSSGAATPSDACAACFTSDQMVITATKDASWTSSAWDWVDTGMRGGHNGISGGLWKVINAMGPVEAGVGMAVGSMMRLGGTAAKTAGQLGREGEAAVRGANIIGDKTRIVVNGRARIPDGLTETTLTEIKNVQSLSFTRQLRDYADFAQQNKLQFDLFTRPDTLLSGPLRDFIEKGVINLRVIP